MSLTKSEKDEIAKSVKELDNTTNEMYEKAARMLRLNDEEFAALVHEHGFIERTQDLVDASIAKGLTMDEIKATIRVDGDADTIADVFDRIVELGLVSVPKFE